MKTAIDTNVLSGLWGKQAERVRASRLLGQAHHDGGLIVCPIVVSELFAHPQLSEEQIWPFLHKNQIMVDFSMPEAVWVTAGRQFALYSRRRKRSGGGEPRRLLADFLVGAHAFIQADRLITFDVDRYQTDFPELKIMAD